MEETISVTCDGALNIPLLEAVERHAEITGA
jgi:hypothetical protein